MKLLFDLFPVLLFFIAYKLFGIYVATTVAIAASAAQVLWVRLRHRRTERMHLATLALLAIFGGMTLALRDPTFVMWKPSLVNWLFGVVFLLTQFLGDKPLVQRMMGHAIDVPDTAWRRLNLAWVAFFIVSGLVNLYVVYIGSGFYEAREALIAATGQSDLDLNQCAQQFSGTLLALCEQARASESSWVDFKLFGMMGMTLAFVLVQTLYLARHLRVEGVEPSAPDNAAGAAIPGLGVTKAAGQADGGSR